MNAPTATLTGALEDYLETIFLLAREHGFARVRDIAAARKVKAGSVSPALKRLSELGLVQYVQREYVSLTGDGEQAARRVLARHDLLLRFLVEVLRMPADAAERDACAMEHSLSAEAMDRLARFFEFLTVCPEGRPQWLDQFHGCHMVQSAQRPVGSADCAAHHRTGLPSPAPAPRLSELKPGQRARVRQIRAQGPIRQRLLDMGVLPETPFTLERVAPSGDPVWVRLQGSELALRRAEADTILVTVD